MPHRLNDDDPLQAFSLPARTWFQESFGKPTPPQDQGWRSIQCGQHTLILAPTGSGKTLAAFLWGIDRRYRELAGETGDAPAEPARSNRKSKAKNQKSGVSVLYISPLKALNNDVHRNLQVPLEGIRRTAEKLGLPFPEITVAVRSGDTPGKERQAMVKHPPDILITTPESLYILLTSPTAREIFRTVRSVIVDEVHTLVGNKRGVHLALSLERLAQIATGPVQRIGLSATIRPLEEAARFLGGNEWSAQMGAAGLVSHLVPRHVEIINAHYHKDVDLKVVSPIADFRNLPGDSVWPSILPRLVELIRTHRSTLIFCNNRRLAEQTADRLNVELAAGEQRGHVSALIQDGVTVGLGMMAAGDGTQVGPIRAHHGSVSREARLEMERDLKEGNLPALVATSSLELGIDIGAIDLVIQLRAPESAARGLQRIGRSGHLVGQTSKARIFPTHREDTIAAAAVAGAMLRGEVESTTTPRNPLDVLAQQIVAMVSVETWEASALYNRVRQAYPYTDLTLQVFRGVLEMLSGRYPAQAHRELRPRLSWDRVNDRLNALPGSRLQAIANGGTIPDQGAFTATLRDGGAKLGELDEEFVYETRIGDVFMLGSQVWRVTNITDDRLEVAEAPGSVPRMPFWRGEMAWRPYELGRQIGEFRRAVAERIVAECGSVGVWECGSTGGAPAGPPSPHAPIPPYPPTLTDWLQRDYALDENSARQVVEYVRSQLRIAGAISSDRTVLVEFFRDAVGDPRMVVHSPFGGRINGAWGLVLAGVLREQVGAEVEVQSNDDGILFRFPASDGEFPRDLVARVTPAEARERILRELPDSPVFGSRFRQNAARALLLPGGRPGKRTPFWLQRLRARDLLQVARRFGDFPIVIETYRDCLQDVMDLPHLEEILGSIREGKMEVVTIETVTPSPVAQSLLKQFSDIFVYEHDTPRAERQLQQAAVDRTLLHDLLKDVALEQFLKPDAIDEVTQRLQRTAPSERARTVEELALLLEQIGDLSRDEIEARCVIEPMPWISRLAGQRRIEAVTIPTAAGPQARWVAAEHAVEYAAAFAAAPAHADGGVEASRRAVLSRFLAHSGPVTAEAIRTRYAFPEEWLRAELERLVEAGELAHGRFSAAAAAEQYLSRPNLEQIHRGTLARLRREVRPVPRTVYADFLAHWQHAHPESRLPGHDALRQLLQQFRALPVPGRLWERDLLPLRLEAYAAADLDALCRSGELIWTGEGGADARRMRVRFLFRGEGHAFLPPAPETLEELPEASRQVLDLLKSEGALFLNEIWGALSLETPELERVLADLVMAGLVTNDSADALRRLLRFEAADAGTRAQRGSASALEAQLAERRARADASNARSAGGGLRKPGRGEYHAAKQRVAERLRRPSAVQWPGRWSPVHRLGVLGKAPSPEEKGAAQARQLLLRWGVVTRACLEQEEGPWDWGLITAQLRLMEMRGEVRRGYFVEGLPGLQYALPEVIERLRSCRDGGSSGDDTPVVLNACDPANLYGPGLEDGPLAQSGEPLAFARVPSAWVAQSRGLPVLVAEGNGASITTARGADEGALARALDALCRHLLRDELRVTLQSWNGRPVLDEGPVSLLESLGFYRDYLSLTRERGSG